MAAFNLQPAQADGTSSRPAPYFAGASACLFSRRLGRPTFMSFALRCSRAGGRAAELLAPGERPRSDRALSCAISRRHRSSTTEARIGRRMPPAPDANESSIIPPARIIDIGRAQDSFASHRPGERRRRRRRQQASGARLPRASFLARATSRQTSQPITLGQIGFAPIRRPLPSNARAPFSEHAKRPAKGAELANLLASFDDGRRKMPATGGR